MTKNTDLYQLKNDNGLVVEFISLGGRITSVKVPEGNSYVDVIIGYDTVEEAIDGDVYFGAICGRAANRIANGSFTLNGETIELNKNEKINSLHGGTNGFHSKYWDVKEITKEGCASAYQLSLVSQDGDENFPGELKVDVIYALNNDNEFTIEFTATTNKTTIVNLTTHPYFNLRGIKKGNILKQQLKINAKTFTPLNKLSIPTGEILDVENTPMDFKFSKKLEEAVASDFEQIRMCNGIDHNWVLDKPLNEMGLAMETVDPESGRSLEVYTTQAGLQIYTGNHFNGTEKGKEGIPIERYAGIAIEPQNFPNAINQSNFPSPILKPGENYQHTIVFKFGF